MGMLFRYHNIDINENKDNGAAEKVAPKPVAQEKEKEVTITVEEINAMTGPKIRKFAKSQGIENPEDLTVGELKAILREKFS